MPHGRKFRLQERIKNPVIVKLGSGQFCLYDLEEAEACVRDGSAKKTSRTFHAMFILPDGSLQKKICRLYERIKFPTVRKKFIVAKSSRWHDSKVADSDGFHTVQGGRYGEKRSH